MLVKGNFKTIIELPKYVDINEWLAFNSKWMVERSRQAGLRTFSLPSAFEFFNYVNLFYGSITDFCTSQTCPTMSAGPGYGRQKDWFEERSDIPTL